jgi:hypothetical protein
VVGRGALRFPAPTGAGALLLAAEAGYSPTAPSRQQVGTAAVGSADGRAAQLSVNLIDLPGGQALGLVHARAGDGWLISPDIRPNNREWEVRYHGQFHPHARLDARLRAREEIRATGGAAGRRSERDVYLRLTLRL